MRRAVCLLLCWLALICGACAQSATDPNEGFSISPDSTYTYTVKWWGRVGRTYFLQYSFDLVTWKYMPDIIEQGGNAAISYDFDRSEEVDVAWRNRVFFRLKYTNLPYSDDFDGDKVPNGVETEIVTDPLHFADSDSDGMPDDWETWFGLDPQNSGDATGNLDGDSLTNLAEYQNGAAGTDPTDYYNGAFPTIQVSSGDGQTAEPGNFSPQPLIFELKIGATPVNHGPVTVYTDDASYGQLSLTNDGTGLATVLHLTTGTDGKVQVYFKHPAANPYIPTVRDIWAKVGSAALGGNFRLGHSIAYSQADYSYPIGTVGRNATEAIDSRIAGKTPASALPVFSTQVHGPLQTPTYVRNTSSWCYDLRQQMTCISPWNSDGGPVEAGTAITTQHIINAKHLHLGAGISVRFITANNTIVTRTIIGMADDPNTDISVCTLSSPLPASITPCKILPTNYPSYLSYLEQGRPPVMMLDQEEKALVSELRAIGSYANFVQPALHVSRLAFYEPAISGDSGDPAFLIINDTLVLLATLHDAGTGSGSFVTPAILNSLIVAADADVVNHPGGTTTTTGLQVQTVDLSGFNTFTPP